MLALVKSALIYSYYKMIFSVLTVRRWRLNCMQLIVLYVYLFVLYPDYDVNVIYATSF